MTASRPTSEDAPNGPGVVLGARLGPFDAGFDADLVRRYGAATHDPSPRVRAGEAVPPLASVTQLWEAQESGRANLISGALQRSASGGVHGEHDLVLHRPIVPGEPLRTWVEGHGARPAGRNSLVTLRYVTVDARDVPVVEQWWTTVYLGVTGQAVGESPPEHAFPEMARERPIGEHVVDVDAQMARRYDAGPAGWAFEAQCAGTTVITHGRAELR